MNKKEWLASLEEHAKNKNISLNPNKKMVEKIIDAEFLIEKRKGAKYCPCRALSGNKQEDTAKICPCIWHLDEIKKDGHCLCNLFVRKGG